MAVRVDVGVGVGVSVRVGSGVTGSHATISTRNAATQIGVMVNNRLIESRPHHRGPVWPAHFPVVAGSLVS